MHALAARTPALLSRALCRQCHRSLATPARSKVFAEGDIVLLRDKNRPYNQGFLTKPLKAGDEFINQHGRLSHDDIIGKTVRETVRTKVREDSKSKGAEYRIQEPTLEEYVRLTSRIVTPIYPNDASFIVSLLDIHVSPTAPSAALPPPLEILEAGTGHGGLTLHLARAIHAANPPLPESLRVEQASTGLDESVEDVTYESTTTDHAAEQTIETWKRNRRAIVHTLDIKPRHSKHAQKIVERFRRGMYAQDIDFHIGDVSAWIKGRWEAQRKGDASKDPEPFLSYVFLDIPSAEKHLESISKALHIDGALAIFNPSVTQIADAVKKVKELQLPFALEKVVELKGYDTVREWDIRVTQPKAVRRAANATSESAEAREENEDGQEDVADNSGHDASLAEQAIGEAEDVERRQREQDEELGASEDDGWKLVCRPKTGLTMGVGGFVGLWRRMKTDCPSAPADSASAERTM